MHSQVCNFLQERGVDESVIEKFKDEKVKLTVVLGYLHIPI